MSLTLSEARARAAAVHDVAYDLDLDLTDTVGGFAMRSTVTFACTAPETFLELAAAEDVRVLLDGRAVDPAYDGTRIRLTGLGGRHEAVVEARLRYVTDGDGMHRFVDPADGATYLGAYLGMDVAQKVFACFDQNDLKAPLTLSVTADPAWTVLANGRTVDRDGGRWRFATTPPIPPAIAVVLAGPWASRTWEHAGTAFGWHARASLAEDLDRDLPELRATTEASFDWYARTFAEPYPFDSYDQAFVPGLNWGAQEMPGCVTYRDEMLPRGRTTDELRGDRAVVVAHEMAHMWFGDLVTMTWWEDTWLQESFADLMGYLVAARAVGRTDALPRMEAARKVRGYDADRRRSTHPVAPLPEDVPDVDAAASNFDMISYAKGSAVLHQLATWLGDEAFLRGLDTYLSRHRFANATLQDFVAALDDSSGRDVRGWVDRWLRRSGFDTVHVRRDGDVPVLTRTGERPHRFTVTAYDEGGDRLGEEPVDLADEPVRLERWAGRVVVPNSGGETFARLELDDLSQSAVLAGLGRVADPLTRAVLWGWVFDRVSTRRLGSREYAGLLALHLPGETCLPVAAAVVQRSLTSVLPLRVSPGDAAAFLDEVAAACRSGLERATDPELGTAFAAGLAAAGRDADVLQRWLAAGSVDGTPAEVPLGPALRWAVVRRLAQLGAVGPDAVEAERLRDRSVEGELGAARASAARPTREAKEAAWTGLSQPDVSNRMFAALAQGLFVAEQSELVAPYLERYLDQAPHWAARGHAFAQIVGRSFPAVPLTGDQVGLLAAALERPGLPPVLRREWSDRFDDLR